MSFHVIFPSFTVRLMRPPAAMEGMQPAIGNRVCRSLFDFWLKVYVASLDIDVVPGISTAFQFSTSEWSRPAETVATQRAWCRSYSSSSSGMVASWSSW